MKLLRDFFRLCMTGFRAVAVRRAANPRAYTVTVPAPLAGVAVPASVVLALPRQRPPVNRRRQPAAALKAPRHHRLGAG
ncbi:MAG: hypothetical protein KGM46_03400 [Pseudomonadota bacterium]|jgi:hypothetical protein|nr:hypothetical protein [Xanthomonadaceae bacterium]MDE1965176.1 hypothetical protein [Xanthomonadaceae bacterium]MDE2249672.1 hypothetical protein [Xanthomonadaceae bacterium]MDE3209764.1 hypothetical protein [Pseudomonadota bacterium]